MAQTRRRRVRDYAAEYARRTRGTARGSLERQAARGHGEFSRREPQRRLREEGLTEARARRLKEATRRAETGTGLTEKEKRIIRDWVRERAREWNRKSVEAGDTWMIEPAEWRAAGNLLVADFSRATFKKFEQLREAVGEVGNTAEFFDAYPAIPVRGVQTARTASQDAFRRRMEVELGMTLNPLLEFFLGGPSPKSQKRAA